MWVSVSYLSHTTHTPSSLLSPEHPCVFSLLPYTRNSIRKTFVALISEILFVFLKRSTTDFTVSRLITTSVLYYLCTFSTFKNAFARARHRHGVPHESSENRSRSRGLTPKLSVPRPAAAQKVHPHGCRYCTRFTLSYVRLHKRRVG